MQLEVAGVSEGTHPNCKTWPVLPIRATIVHFGRELFYRLVNDSRSVHPATATSCDIPTTPSSTEPWSSQADHQ